MSDKIKLVLSNAHGINNSLASIALYTQMSLRTPGLPPKIYKNLEVITDQVKDAYDLSKQILDFNRRAIICEILDMALFLEETVDLLKHTLPGNIEIALIHRPGEYTIDAILESVQQAIMNLALNARDAMPEGGVLRIGLDRLRIEQHQETPLPEMQVGEWVQVTVADTGTGIPPEVLPHIFEPFFTTKRPPRTGLGLAQVYGIVRSHGGHIGVEIRVGADCGQSGAMFTMYWPAVAVTESQPDTTVELVTDLVRKSDEIVLVVEDNHAMRAALIGYLEMLNYQVLEAATAQEALTVFTKCQDEISLVLSEQMMPGMGGLELAHTLKQRGHGDKVLILTNYVQDWEIDDTVPKGVVGWVRKTSQLRRRLAKAVARALDTD